VKAACTVWRGAKGVKAPDLSRLLLNSEYSAKYLQQLWKKVRKQGGLCTGITQNVVDLLQNYTATTMLANSEFVALLKQANTDSAKMADVIGVSQAQLRYVTNTASGMGLIKCGSVVIPFDNQISKDTNLYKLYNTNIHERIAEQKKAEKEKAERGEELTVEHDDSTKMRHNMAIDTATKRHDTEDISTKNRHDLDEDSDNVPNNGLFFTSNDCSDDYDVGTEESKVEIHTMGTFLG